MSTEPFDFSDHSHRRYNPLTDSWVLVSPHRAKRPWLGQKESQSNNVIPSYDPKCFLCPTNKRSSGAVNPDYNTTYIFPNDFMAMKEVQPLYLEPVINDNSTEIDILSNRLLKTSGVRGKCGVICFSPNHALTLPQLPVKEIKHVIVTWKEIYESLKKESIVDGKPFRYVQIFENKGSVMGCSNPHPHCQYWCSESIPTELNKELKSFQKYYEKYNTHLLEDYLKLELTKKKRIIVENESFVALVPYWAVWPFESMIISKQKVPSIENFTEIQINDLADIIKRLTVKYDNLFEVSFPYSMGIHQAPISNGQGDEDKSGQLLSHFHMHFYPPLLRSATVRKFLVGYELMAEPQRDLTAEQATDRLTALSDILYSNNK